jgi:hypothetical protein
MLKYVKWLMAAIMVTAVANGCGYNTLQQHGRNCVQSLGRC